VLINAELIIIDFEILLNQNISSLEYANTISNLYRFSKNIKQMRIAVCIKKSCPLKLIKELQESDILGLVPDSEDFGYANTLSAIDTLLKHKPHWPKYIIKELVKLDAPVKAAASELNLTARQDQILSLVCNRGLSNKSIANLLKISESTVKIHVSSVMRTYGVRNRTQLALAASRSLKA
jgi:DNA-binding NarL/FixJ family response regulator